MKIIKNANGKKTVKLSQKDWEEFGKKAGWLDEDGNLVVQAEDMVREAEPAPSTERSGPAPAAPTTKPRTTPGEKTKPGKPGKRRPRNPKPIVQPKPKAEEPEEDLPLAAQVSPDNLPTITSELKKKISGYEIRLLEQKVAAADYDASVQRGVRNFWQDIPQNNILSQNPVLSHYGDELARANYEYITNIAEEKDIPVNTNIQQVMMQILGLLREIQALEQGNEEQLMDLAKDVISRKWNVDRDELEIKYMEEMGPSGEEDFPEVDIEITPELEGEINKRIIMNSLAQGAGLNELFDVTEMEEVQGAINDINPQLLGLYEKFSNLMCQHFYYIDPEMVRMMADQLGQKGTGWSHNDDEGNTVAQGMNFIIICQELTKGIFSKATDHQLDNESRASRGQRPLEMEEAIAILKESDELVNEQMQMQIGPENFRRFMQCKPEDIVGLGLVGYMGAGPVQELFEASSYIISDQEEAKEILNRFKDQLDETGFWETETDEEDKDAGDIDEGTGDAIDGAEVDPSDPLSPGAEEDLDELIWDDVDFEAELASLFGPSTKDEPLPPKRKHPEEDLPPVEFDDDDDDDDPFFMN